MLEALVIAGIVAAPLGAAALFPPARPGSHSPGHRHQVMTRAVSIALAVPANLREGHGPGRDTRLRSEQVNGSAEEQRGLRRPRGPRRVSGEGI